MSGRYEADVVVIGSGSAGSVVAGRLAEAGVRVLVIEAGGRDRNPLYRVPLMTGLLLRSRRGNWFYHTEPEPGLNGRRLFWPRGKVLGGSSSINGMVWTRGFPADCDAWAQTGLPGWDWESVLATYRGLERHWSGETAHHGGSGRQRVCTRSPRRSWTRGRKRACRKATISTVPHPSAWAATISPSMAAAG